MHTCSLEFDEESISNIRIKNAVLINKHLSLNLPERVASELAHDVGEICKIRRNSGKFDLFDSLWHVHGNNLRKWVGVTSLLSLVCIVL